jgi:diaminopimelate decarboxylase
MAWWENRFLSVKDGKLYLERREAAKIAAKHGTPLFVYSRKQVLANLAKLRRAFERKTDLETRICYAMKANPNRQILRILKAAGTWIDAVSPGEVHEALRAGFAPRKILFTGTSVSAEDFRQAFAVAGLTVNIDAFEQLEIMKSVRDRWFKERTIRVSVRWNPGIGRGFNPKVVTAGNRSPDGTPIKFGVEEKKILATFQKARDYGFLPVGLHQHLGSGWVKDDLAEVTKAAAKMIQKASELERKGFELEFLDFGGGFGPRYSKNQRLFPVEQYAAFICREIKKRGLKVRALAVEPGKYLLADAGVLLLRVEYLKESYGNLFACVNGGTFNTLPRPAIYLKAYHEIVPCSGLNSTKKRRITIAGNLCETGDVFGKEILMPVPKAGDILAVLNTGAYARTMASNYNLRPIPKEIII